MVNLAFIDVTTFGDALNPGLRYTASNNALSSTTQAGLSFEFKFRVRQKDGLSLIKDNSLALNGFFIESGDGLIEIVEGVFKDLGLTEPLEKEFGGFVSKLVRFNVPESLPNIFADDVNFASPQSEIFVDTQILIEIPPGTFAGITVFEQRFSQVQAAGGVIPEPGTFSLLGIGLAGLALHQWRRKK